MPSRKRKRKTVLARAGGVCSSHLLLLPFEIRIQTYRYCYERNDEQILRGESLPDDNIKPEISPTVIRRAKERSFFQRSRCRLPFLHQSLLFVCRQTHIDVWPLYAADHSFGFDHPIRFANKFLSFQPPQCLTCIRHLSLPIGDATKTYNPESQIRMKEMDLDVVRLVQHYRDVFDQLLSFTWEVCDKTLHYDNMTESQRDAYYTVLDILLEPYAGDRPGDETTSSDSRLDGEPLEGRRAARGGLKWRTGIVSCDRKLMTKSGVIQYDESFMVFFERLPPEFPNCADGKKGLRYINVAKWLTEPMVPPPSYADQGLRLFTSARAPCTPQLPTTWNTHGVQWEEGEVDSRSGTDMLVHASLVDVGT